MMSPHPPVQNYLPHLFVPINTSGITLISKVANFPTTMLTVPLSLFVILSTLFTFIEAPGSLGINTSC